jgi:lysophospholipase L1-like esterase
VANNLGLYYIDFTSTLVSGDYQADGINPTAAGHTKLANLYVSSLLTGASGGIALMTGTASGSATVTAASSSPFIGVASASGSATVSGVGRATRAATGASTGMATVSGQTTWGGTYVASKRRTLMFVGDSITWGFGVTQAQAYPALLQERTDTASTPAGSTSLWTARNVQADDIIVNNPSSPRDGVAFKLTNDTSAGGSVGFDNNGPFNSLFASTISPTYDPAILLNSQNDGVIAQPTSPTRFFTVMVKVEGSGTATLKGYNSSGVEIPDLSGSGGNATVGNTNLITTNVYRFVFDASTTSSAFLLRRVDTNSSVNVRLLTVNPTNAYPSSNYVGVQINARGSYVFSDYARTLPTAVDNVPLIVDTIIHPQSEAGSPNTHPIFVLALGTVSIYHNPTYPASYDRRISPAQYQTDLSYLVARIKAALPNAPIILTHPPIPDSSIWVTSSPRANYDAAVVSVAAANGLFRVDLRSVLTNSDYISGDGIHPTPTGHGKLRDAYVSALLL